jgi:hypothetical protein
LWGLCETRARRHGQRDGEHEHANAHYRALRRSAQYFIRSDTARFSAADILRRRPLLGGPCGFGRSSITAAGQPPRNRSGTRLG